MTIDGNATTIHHNNKEGYSYGLYGCNSSSYIHLVSPLTKEMISTNNDSYLNDGGQRNYSGKIQTISMHTTYEQQHHGRKEVKDT